MKKTTKQSANWAKLLIIVPAIALIAVVAWHVIYIKNSSSNNEKSNSPISEYEGEVNNAYSNIPAGEIDAIISQGDVIWDLNNPYYFYENNPIAALVHIDSVDGGRSYDEVTESYIYPYTYGTMTILETYKGDILESKKINYTRLGGIVTYDEYYKSLNKEQQEKRDRLSGGVKPEKDYVEMMFMDDIRIESGKDYVVFMEPEYSKSGKLVSYVLHGMQYGLREARSEDGQTMVLNNDTGEWENLSNIVKL